MDFAPPHPPPPLPPHPPQALLIVCHDITFNAISCLGIQQERKVSRPGHPMAFSLFFKTKQNKTFLHLFICMCGVLTQFPSLCSQVVESLQCLSVPEMIKYIFNVAHVTHILI